MDNTARTSPILVTGGTGNLGSHVLPLLRAAGRDVRVLSRHRHEPAEGVEYVTGDLLKGEGIAAAVAGVDTVLHLAGSQNGDDRATRNLVRAAAGAGVRHLVHISIIRADRIPLGYYRSKAGAEQAVTASGVPWTMLRAAQFHDLIFTLIQAMSKLPLAPVPSGMRVQPVDTGEVAARLVELTLGEPAGEVPDLAGPTVYEMRELFGQYLEATGKRRLRVPVRIPGRAGRAYRNGDNLNVDDATLGTRTWEDYLAERIGERAR